MEPTERGEAKRETGEVWASDRNVTALGGLQEPLSGRDQSSSEAGRI